MIDLKKIKKDESKEVLLALAISSLIAKKDDRFNEIIFNYDSDYNIDRIRRLRTKNERQIFLDVLEDLLMKVRKK